MSVYTEEYLKNKLTEKLNAAFVVSENNDEKLSGTMKFFQC